MLDCLATRRDSESAIRRFLEEARIVLSDHGRLVCIDRTSVCIPRQRSLRCGQVKSFMAGSARPMHLRVLRPLSNSIAESSDEEICDRGKALDCGTASHSPRKYLTLRWEKKGAGLSTRRFGDTLLVLDADGCASAAGICKGDRILSVNNGNYSFGWLQDKLHTSANGEVKLLVECARSDLLANDRTRASSQDNHPLRMRRAATPRRSQSNNGRKRHVLPQLPNPISPLHDTTESLFAPLASARQSGNLTARTNWAQMR
eukprot:gnl/MRDRNA2_/MRDRNA2_58793_c0_seq1.p1 gnl/MRDRNA2_/MRDRNA2_58793_c0~~gnl/MRDRNA2_/MRDRNA2_58793_c0_seq1.p1  ORF type:complete len:259 (-),score=17.01 gnl/MRDRNA2_/MRDRNA2_58793_c0_seq1:350-1126(-)